MQNPWSGIAYVKLKHVLRSSRLVEGIGVNTDTGRILISPEVQLGKERVDKLLTWPYVFGTSGHVIDLISAQLHDDIVRLWQEIKGLPGNGGCNLDTDGPEGRSKYECV